MNFESIYLVANLGTYDFENVVLLADDVDAIVTELVNAAAIGQTSAEWCEKLLFLSHILGCALEASRTVVKNFDTLEELLRINWSGARAERKWEFVRETSGTGIVNRVARGILVGEDGEKCMTVVKMFYKKFSSKTEFSKMIGEVRKELVWKQAALDYLCLKGSVDASVRKAVENLGRVDDFLSGDPRDVIRNARTWELPSLIHLVDCSSVGSDSLNKLLAGILIHIQIGSEDFLRGQLSAIRNLTNDHRSLEKYQNLMEFQPFYEVNLELLKTHQRRLLEKQFPYDSNTILLCHLMYAKSQSWQFLKDFLNEESLGGPNNLELVLAELQNFG